jgi:hypothetical protein
MRADRGLYKPNMAKPSPRNLISSRDAQISRKNQ